MTDLAVVTGGNRGLGLETCRQLAQRGMRVVLASRDRARGERAAAELGVEARQLDVADPASVAAFALSIDEPIAALVNNAGVSLDGFDAEVARATLEVNYFGAARVTGALLPQIERGGRIVLVSSGMGQLSAFGKSIARRFLDPALDRPGLDALAREFVDAVARGEHARLGWPSNAYRVSKAALNALARILGPELAPRGILVNAVCPGWVRTDMGGRWAPRSVEEGARGIVWAATLPPGGPTGGYFRDGRALAW